MKPPAPGMRRTRVLLILGAVALAVAAKAWASATVDGPFDPGKGYASGYFVTLDVQNAAPLIAGGMTWTCQDPVSGDVIMPIAQDSPNKIGGNEAPPHTDWTVPEPSTLLLVGSGVLFVSGVILRRRMK